MAESDIVEPVENEDRMLIRSVGRAMWRNEVAASASAEDRKASWKDGQANYRRQARRMIRLLEGEGVTLSVSGTDVETDDD